MLISTEQGRIEISDAVLEELIAQVVKDSLGVSEVSSRNIADNLAGFFRFDTPRRGVHLRRVSEGGSTPEGLIIELRMQFWEASGIAAYVADLVSKLQELLCLGLGADINEIHIEVDSIAARSQSANSIRS